MASDVTITANVIEGSVLGSNVQNGSSVNTDVAFGTPVTANVVTGAKGDKGDTGAKGDTGDTGPQGPQGDQGIQGVQGDPGVDGSTWYSDSGTTDNGDGADGDYYFRTDTGEVYTKVSGDCDSAIADLTGPQGDQGIQGVQGDTGATGATGSTGDTGAKGDTGANGNTVLNGSGAPTTEGVDGDFYIDTSTNDIYGPKTSGSWGSGTSLIGPQGDTGPQGDPGAGLPMGGTTGQQLVKLSNTDYDYDWETPAGAGDMLASTYDPTNVADDAFDQDNMVSGTTNKNYTATEQTKLAGIASGATANSKAAGSELDTGTDDAKFATAKALKDSHNVPSVAPGTSGNYMKSDGTDWTSAAIPTWNQNTTGSAATLTTARAIYGNNFDGSAALTQIIASTYGGTGNGFTKFTGPTTSEKTFTLPNSSKTLLYSGGPLGTPSSGTLTNATGLPVSGITSSTSTALGVGSLEVGHATDTTIARVSAGKISVEGVNVVTTSSTDTLTNKTIASGSNTITGIAPADLAAASVQNDTSNTTITAPRIEAGWGYMTAGGSVGSINEAVTFPSAFSSAPYVVCSFVGKKTGSDPTTIGDVNSSHDSTTSAKPYSISTTGFTIYVNTVTNFSTNDRVMYSWIAFGAA